MHVELITIGSELLSGRTLNTNAVFIGDQLAKAGIMLDRQITIHDEHEIIISTIRDCMTRADWVIVSGGLGPTNDDITKKALARVFNRPLVFHDEILEDLKKRYVRSGRPVNPQLETQAVQPGDAELVPNTVGTAVGIILNEGKKYLAAVPGVPREMEPMIADHIVPKIAAMMTVRSETVCWSTTGLPESILYQSVEHLINDMPEVTVAFQPSALGVKLRTTASGPDASGALKRFADVARPLIGDALYAEEDIGLETVLGQMLKDRGQTVALAESCTGGLAAKRLTDISGSSAYVMGGVVAYDNSAKINLLGVDSGLIEQHGAVSEQVARAMANGARQRFDSDYALSITGVAGPTGGTDDKPVGLVWFGLAMRDGETVTEEKRFLGNREMVRERAAQHALNLLRLHLIKTT